MWVPIVMHALDVVHPRHIIPARNGIMGAGVVHPVVIIVATAAQAYGCGQYQDQDALGQDLCCPCHDSLLPGLIEEKALI
jgi:hypothetical protein